MRCARPLRLGLLRWHRFEPLRDCPAFDQQFAHPLEQQDNSVGRVGAVRGHRLLRPGFQDLDHEAVEILPLANRPRTQPLRQCSAQIQGEHQLDVARYR